MRRRTLYEKLTLVLVLLFLTVCGGCFLSQRAQTGRYQVTVSKAAREDDSQPQQDGWPDSLLPGERLNLNAASAADLTRLPQIGQSRAQAIVDWREEYGPFQTIEDVMKVRGIGEGIFGQIQEYITVENTG